MTLKIEKIKTDPSLEPLEVPYPDIMPQHHFTMLIVAGMGSGKTNLICNLITNHYKGYYHQILVVSPTVGNDPKWDVVKEVKGVLAENKPLKKAMDDEMTEETGNRKLPKVVHVDEESVEKAQEQTKPKFDSRMKEEDFFSDMSEIPDRMQIQNDTVEELRERGYGSKSQMMTNRMLVILDDQAGKFDGNTKNSPLTNFWFKFRHYNCSVIVVAQSVKAIPKQMRTTVSSLVVFQVNSEEQEALYKEFPANLEKDEWLTIYNECTEEQYNFMYINLKFKRYENVFKNFEYMMQVGNEEEEPQKKRR